MSLVTANSKTNLCTRKAAISIEISTDIAAFLLL